MDLAAVTNNPELLGALLTSGFTHQHILQEVIDGGHHTLMPMLRAEHVQFNTCLHGGLSLLTYAALQRQHACMSELLLNGANTEYVDQNGNTPLMSLCRQHDNYCEEIALLMQHGADAHKCVDDESAFTIAICRRQLESLECMLHEGAHVNQADDRGVTPLMSAIRATQLPIVKQLLAAGANVSAKDTRGETALFYCLRVMMHFGFSSRYVCMNKYISELLTYGIDVDVPNVFGQTALLYAMKTNVSAHIDHLLAAHADVCVQTEQGLTPLLLAIANGNIQLTQRLIKLGSVHTGYRKHSASWERMNTSGERFSISDKLDTHTNVWNCELMNKLFFAIGETLDRTRVDHKHSVFDDVQMDITSMHLHRICRRVIRAYCRENNPTNLVAQIQLLPLPGVVKNFLCYGLDLTQIYEVS